MNEWAGFFLGVIAVSAAVQCAFMIVAALSLQRTGKQVKELCDKFDNELKPALEDIRKGASNLRAVSDIAHVQMKRVEELVSESIVGVETTIEELRSLVKSSLNTASLFTAFWDGLRQGLERFRTSPRRPPAGPRRAEDADEHLFIG